MSARLGLLTVCDITAGRRKRYEINGIGVLRTWDKLLRALIQVVDDDVVSSDVDKLLLLVHVQAVVELPINSEDKFGCNGYALHAHIRLNHL